MQQLLTLSQQVSEFAFLDGKRVELAKLELDEIEPRRPVGIRSNQIFILLF